jgi:hypothetical protein
MDNSPQFGQLERVQVATSRRRLDATRRTMLEESADQAGLNVLTAPNKQVCRVHALRGHANALCEGCTQPRSFRSLSEPLFLFQRSGLKNAILVVEEVPMLGRHFAQRDTRDRAPTGMSVDGDEPEWVSAPPVSAVSQNEPH